jgi:hypothetical protein
VIFIDVQEQSDRDSSSPGARILVYKSQNRKYSDVLLIVGRLDVYGQSFAPIGLHKTDAAFDWLLKKMALHCLSKSKTAYRHHLYKF